MAESDKLPKEDRPEIGPPDLSSIAAQEKGDPDKSAKEDGYYNPEGDSAKGFDAAALLAPGGFKNLFFGSSRKKKRTIGGTIVAIAVGFAIYAATIISGPAQLVQLSQILQRNFHGLNSSSSNRSNQLLRFAGVEDVGETRLGILGRNYLRSVVGQLADIGIGFDTNSIGNLKKVTINTEDAKLNENFPELKDMSEAERQAWLSDHYDITTETITSEGKGVFSIDATDLPLKTVSTLANNTLSFLDDGKIVTAINERILSTYLGIPSLFHPLQRAKAAAEAKLVNAAERKADEQNQEEELDSSTEDEATPAVDDVESQKSTFGSAAMKLLLVTGGACFIRSVSNDVVTINRDRVVLPSVVQAANFIAIGDQVESGQDVSAEQLNELNDSLSNSTGQNIWQGTALQATEGDAVPSGTDLPEDYRQAYDPNTTAQNINKWASDAIGGSTIAGFACSGPGLLLQLAGGFYLAASSAVADVGSGFSLTPEIAAGWTAKFSLDFAVSATAMHFVQNFILNNATSAKLAKDAFSGPVGGDLLAYGAREAANIGARAEGGIALKGSGSTTYSFQSSPIKSFQEESFFARVFDINDSRSLLGSLIDKVSPKFMTNLVNIIDGFSSIGRGISSNLSSIIIPKSLADSSSYNWGFPTYGIPQDIINDPNLVNPYNNASQVATILSSPSGSNYISKAATCFGVNLVNQGGVWNVTAGSMVNPNSDDYANAGCDDYSSDYNWKRVILFVFDTRQMQSISCYSGDDQSCSEIGYNQLSSSGSSNVTTPPTADISAYKNPLRDVKGLFSRRIDQGVDYGGHGPIYAIGNGKVDITCKYGQACSNGQSSGWPGPGGQSGGWVSYTLSDGPAAGKIVYFAESCQPTVSPGNIVGPDTVICQMNGDNDPWIETGWASGNGTTSMAVGCWDSVSSQFGVNFSQLLQKLGAPPGIPQEPNPPCTLPSGWPTW